MLAFKELEYRNDMEKRAWELSYIMKPHTKKGTNLKPKDIFDYDKIKLEMNKTEDDEAEAFEQMFMTKEEKGKIRSEKIINLLKEINKRKAEQNGD